MHLNGIGGQLMSEIQQFAEWLLEEGRSTKTIETYVTDVKGFLLFLRLKTRNETVLSRFSFVRYKEYLINRNYAISTINKKINSLLVYNTFLKMNGSVKKIFINLKRDRIPIADGSEREVQSLSDEQVETLLFYVEDESKVSQRNKLIVYLLLYTGVRVSELIGIKLVDIDVLTNTLKVIGKGGKHREIGLRSDVLQLIQKYRKEDRGKSAYADSPYLLVSQRANKMHRDAVRYWLAKVGEDIGFHLHPHLFRHTFCTRLLKHTDLTTVSKLAGHANVNMTAKYYIGITRKEKQTAVEKL